MQAIVWHNVMGYSSSTFTILPPIIRNVWLILALYYFMLSMPCMIVIGIMPKRIDLLGMQNVNVTVMLKGITLEILLKSSANNYILLQACKSHDHDHQWADYVMTDYLKTKGNMNITLWDLCETLIVYILLGTFQSVHMVLTVNKPDVRGFISWIVSADWNPCSERFLSCLLMMTLSNLDIIFRTDENHPCWIGKYLCIVQFQIYL